MLNPFKSVFSIWLKRPWIFELGSKFYGWFTDQPIWRESCAGLVSFFPAPREGRPLCVLELGCGPGVTAIELKRRRQDALVIGLDLAPRMLDAARTQVKQYGLAGQIPLVLADATALPFAADTVDVVTGHSFLYLVPDREGVLREAARVIRPGGRYASMEPHGGNVQPGALRHSFRNLRYAVSVVLWRPYSRFHGQFTDARFRDLFRRAGLTPIGSELVQEGMGIIGSAEKDRAHG